MTTQLPGAMRETLCPHCDTWPLTASADIGNEPIYVCSNCGCSFSVVALDLIAAGDHCPVALREDEGG